LVKWELDVSDNLNQRAEGFSLSIGLDKIEFIKFAVLMQLEKMESQMDGRRKSDSAGVNTLSKVYIEMNDKQVPVG